MIQLNWTTAVPEDLKQSFLRWLNDLNCFSSLSIPRWFFTQKPEWSAEFPHFLLGNCRIFVEGKTLSP